MDLDNRRIIEELDTSRRDFLKLLGKGAAIGSKLKLPAQDIVKAAASTNVNNDFAGNVLYKALYQKILSNKDRFNQIVNPQAVGTHKKIDDNTVKKLADAAFAVIADDKEKMKKFQSSLEEYHKANPDLLKNQDFDEYVDYAYGEFHFLDPYQMMVKALTSMGKTNSNFVDPHEMQKLVDNMLNRFGYTDPEYDEYRKNKREIDDKKEKYPDDYLERDYAEGPHMNSFKPEMSFKQFYLTEKKNMIYAGNCTQDDIVDEIFGDVNNFANLVDKHGDEFEINNLVVKYDPDTDVHYFYWKNSKQVDEDEDMPMTVFAGPGEVEAANKGKKMRKKIPQQPNVAGSPDMINNPGPNYANQPSLGQTKHRTYKNKNLVSGVFKTDV